ncbi:MAG: TetR/AcrR family transcriptional regulator [Myxococcales bacterium]|jgi:TetR/AcrR family transcriptional repressor of nem operon
MSTKSGVPTREKLLEVSEALINQRGFAGTSIDQIIAETGVTKGTFFYHFKTKQDLARALIERFAAADQDLLRSSMERAEKLSPDPVQQVLIFMGLLLETAEALDETPQPGCLFATYCFEKGLFDDQTYDVISNAMLSWRKVLGEKLRAAADKAPPRADVDLDALADMVTVVFEGAFVVSRSLEGPGVFAAQLRNYRTFLQLLFDA